MRRTRLKWLIAPPLLVIAGGAVVLTESVIHPPQSARRPADPALAASLAEESSADWTSAAITAPDGTRLNAWYFTPKRATGAAFIALHGISDTRVGVLGHARLLLRHGYSVLTPDHRGHGESAGAAITFGLRESEDITRWVDWLKQEQRITHVFGLGESYGGSILLQALPREPRIEGAIAECAFTSLRAIAAERVGQKLGLGPAVSHVTLAPLIESALLYARLRYSLALGGVNTAAALSAVNTPVFLIHGAADTNIEPSHSIALARSSRSVRLWLVEDASHTGALAANPVEFEHRVLEWLASVQQKPTSQIKVPRPAFSGPASAENERPASPGAH